MDYLNFQPQPLPLPPSSELSKDLLANEALNTSPIDTVLTIFKEKIENRDLSDLTKLKEALSNQIQQIKNDTTGVMAFFRYLFYPTLKAEKHKELELATALHHFIENILDSKYEIMNRIEDTGVKIFSKTTEKSIDDTSPLKTTGSREIPGIGEVLQEEEGVEDTSPPPPPGPPPPPITEKRKIDPEQAHLEREQKKLANQLRERSIPDNFYVIVPPKNENLLQKSKSTLETEIKMLSEMIKNEEVIPKAIDSLRQMIENKKKEVARIEEELKGIKTPLRYPSLEFKEKVKKYTNEELKILIGIYYDGKEPKKPDMADYDPQSYSYYAMEKNKVLIDQVIKEWKSLTSTESGKAFFTQKDEWKRYLDTSIFGILETLKKRDPSTSKSERLEEPNYTIPPYDPKKKTTIHKNPVSPSESKAQGSLVESIQKGHKLKPARERKLAPEQEVKLTPQEQLLKDIQQRRKE